MQVGYTGRMRFFSTDPNEPGPPTGKPGGPATSAAIVLRTLAFLIAVVIVSVATLWPLAEALL